MKVLLMLLVVATVTVRFCTAEATAGDFEMDDKCVGKKNGDCCESRTHPEDCSMFCNIPPGICDWYNPNKPHDD